MPKKLVGATEYAKMRGVSRRAVYDAMKARIAGAVDENNKIDVELADVLWAQNTNPDQGYHGHSKQRRKSSELEDLEEKAASVGIDPANPPTLVESKTLEAAYKAKLAGIEYDEKTARLIDMEQVKKQAFQLARLTRDAMLAIPDRVSAEIAGITDPFVIHSKLTAEIRMVIAEICKVEGTDAA